MSAPINSMYRVLSHKLRVDILLKMTENGESWSPNMLAKALDAKLADVSYHMGVLKREALVTLVNTVPRRGAVEHYYKPIEGIDVLLASARELSDNIERVTA